jgi:hypothetical protein
MAHPVVILRHSPEWERVGTEVPVSKTPFEVRCDLGGDLSILDREHWGDSAVLSRGVTGECKVDIATSRFGLRDHNPPISVVLRSGDVFVLGNSILLYLDRGDSRTPVETVYELMTRDGLLRCCNRRRFGEHAETEILRAKRHETPVSVVRLVLCGSPHLLRSWRGYRALKAIAESLDLKPGWQVGRLGEFELAWLLPEMADPEISTLESLLNQAVSTAAEQGFGDVTALTARIVRRSSAACATSEELLG